MSGVTSTPRTVSAPAALARAGFADTAQAERLLGDPALAGLIDPLDDVFGDGLVDALAQVADPDLALLGLVRLMESLRGTHRGSDHIAELIATLRRPGPGRTRMLAVLGSSTALIDHLVGHPGHWSDVTGAARTSAEAYREALVAAVTEPAGRTPYDALRIAYRRELLGIAALDLTAADPVTELPHTAQALAELAAAALEAALSIATAEIGEGAQRCRFAVIGMGKCGGRELNYVSDVDVIFVAEPAQGVDEQVALAVGTHLATALMKACAAATAEGVLWPVDAALRPEGRNGPLVRTVASHCQYYERWAKTWEFQALLKARTVAGDEALGAQYLETVRPLVWQAASREHFVQDVQAMRRRVEQHVPEAEAGRQLKLGPGGLRDVEFSVQLLQLVHGRSDESLRSGTTLEALEALSRGGYVGRDDAAVLDDAYRFLRTLEHRIQLFRLRRTHVMPTAEADLRRLGRALGYRREPAKEVVDQWQRQAREVRRLHERLFYRPLLSAVARLSSREATLSPEAAQERLSALGFRNPVASLRRIEAMTSGVSRRAAIQRTLLPVMLGWFADEAAPDEGLLSFSKISEALGASHWYLKMLRDEGSTAERLAHVLARSRYAAGLLERAPDTVAILGDSRGLVPRSRAAIIGTMALASRRRSGVDEAMAAARAIRRQELVRIVAADLTGSIGLDEVGAALTDLTAATLQTALDLAIDRVESERGRPLGTRLLIAGMGRLGGAEMGYASDADVLFVHQPGGVGGGDGAVDITGTANDGEDAAAAEDAQRAALQVVQEVRRLMAAAGPDPTIVVDADLRPEGKAGPLIRTLDSYRAYYRRWSSPWEAQALLRCQAVAGDPDLAREFTELIDPLRWPEGGIDGTAVREIRRLKARMESERLPRGGDPKTHFKLGLGGLSDVEWTVQLLQLCYAYRVPGLRTTRTLPALAAAREAGLVSQHDAEALELAWRTTSMLRDAGVLWRGRPVDSVPSDLRDADGMTRIMGWRAGMGATLGEEYRRIGRHARSAVLRLFYDSPVPTESRTTAARTGVREGQGHGPTRS